jgi:hypothetical protein
MPICLARLYQFLPRCGAGVPPTGVIDGVTDGFANGPHEFRTKRTSVLPLRSTYAFRVGFEAKLALG